MYDVPGPLLSLGDTALATLIHNSKEYIVSFDEVKNVTGLICHVIKWAIKVKIQVMPEHTGVSHNPALGGEYLNKILKELDKVIGLIRPALETLSLFASHMKKM